MILLKKPGSKRKHYKYSIILYVSISLIFVIGGVFFILAILSSEADDGSNMPDNTIQATHNTKDNTVKPQIDPVKYEHRTETINGLKQEINILEVNPAVAGVRIQPVLSYDLIYGFEKLSDMSSRKNAYAAINCGFFHEFGLPAGMVVIDGEMFCASTGRYPVFMMEKGKASLEEITSKLAIEYTREAVGESADAAMKVDSAKVDGLKLINTGSFPVDIYNFPASGREIAVYTPYYGKTNRADRKNITATIVNGTVEKIAFYPGETGIPSEGMLVSFFDTQKYTGIETPLRVGDAVRLEHLPVVRENADAYECGCWLVRDGKPAAPEKDPWIGVLTNRDPRTAIGIKADGSVLLVTVDGRQPGFSAGFTGAELADYLIGLGAYEAAMLDGGASTEMIVEGRLVSRPSFKGEERPLAGGILVLRE